MFEVFLDFMKSPLSQVPAIFLWRTVGDMWHEVYGIYMLELICGMKDMMVWNLYTL